jgi:glycosyltransferase involved in cell wall biosynthesis
MAQASLERGHMKALVVAPEPFFSPRGTPFSVYYRTLVTARLGVEVDLLTYGEGQDVDIPGVRLIRIPRFAFLGPVGVGPSFLKVFLDAFLIVWTVFLLLRHRYDFVHAHEEAIFWCRFLKPLFRFKLVYDMHSSLPQQLTNFQFSKSKLLFKTFEWLERTCLQASDAVITICPDLEKYALSTGIAPARHLLIENSLFGEVRLKGQDQAARNGSQTPLLNGQVSGSLIVYAGTFEPYQGLDILIRAFHRVAERRPDTRLLMVGGTARQVEEMKRLANQEGLNGRCTFTGRVSKREATSLLDRADVLVSPRREGTNTPLKVYEQLASGKPLVATRIGSHTQVLSDEVCFLVDPEPEAMAAGILSALEDTPKLRELVANARALYEQQYSASAYDAKMRRLLEILR